MYGSLVDFQPAPQESVICHRSAHFLTSGYSAQNYKCDSAGGNALTSYECAQLVSSTSQRQTQKQAVCCGGQTLLAQFGFLYEADRGAYP